MRLKITILIAILLSLMMFASAALAGDPLKEDKDFLGSDPDGDGVLTWEEFVLGTDPFNSDSDNDGLPDGWEKEYWPTMNPADSSDAHLDFDYDPTSNGTGYDRGERDATFEAVQKLVGGQPMSWPSNPDILFTQPIPGEDGPHYDNYEEYYRMYTDLENQNIIRYMHTNPLKPDTDGDLILDPDDFEPLGWKNDGTSPGGCDIKEPALKVNPDITNNKDINTDVGMEPKYESTPTVLYDLNVESGNTEAQTSVEDNKGKSKSFPDMDNDGI